MWRFLFAGLIILAVLIFGFSLIDASGDGEITASALFTTGATDESGFARAIEPREWQFPLDYGAHPEFQTEWWYYTGNIADETGRRFGFQFTIFRRAITPRTYTSDSEWRTDQVYMAHFTVTDVADEAFYHTERLSRGSAGLAGAQAEPRYHLWLEDWQISALNDDSTLTQITAATDAVAIDLTLEQVKPPALQGAAGLSPKGEKPGNASYYYSLSRLLTEGTIRIKGESFAVTGNTWMDHEFSTGALTDDTQGWDWFGLIFDDGRELMIGQIRLVDGDKQPAFGGLLINADGSTQYLSADDFTITPLDSWTSPHTGAVYPSGWEIALDAGGESLRFTATPLILDQELQGSNGGIAYWEGAVELSGDVGGYGYAELTGYASAMTGRF